jgi:hypothetical protein
MRSRDKPTSTGCTLVRRAEGPHCFVLLTCQPVQGYRVHFRATIIAVSYGGNTCNDPQHALCDLYIARFAANYCFADSITIHRPPTTTKENYRTTMKIPRHSPRHQHQPRQSRHQHQHNRHASLHITHDQALAVIRISASGEHASLRGSQQ